MTRYVALLRAVNVGGTGRLPMADLKALCRSAGFSEVETVLASGNAVFDSPFAPGEVRAKLEAELRDYAGAPVGVVVRTGAELQAVLDANPFAEHPAEKTLALFLDEPARPASLALARGAASETIRLGTREIYIHYPQGVGASKLRLPAAREGTARNMNTLAKLARLVARP